MLLAPYSGDRPPTAPVRWLKPGENWFAAPELGVLAHIFQQDMLNLEELQKGLRNNQRKKVVFGAYQ